MKRRTLCGLSIVIASMAAFLFLHSQPAQADDELLLTGIVKSIDPVRGTVFIDVKSSSCRGIRKFKLEDASEKEDLIGRKINFTIDSSMCNDDETHTMTILGE